MHQSCVRTELSAVNGHSLRFKYSATVALDLEVHDRSDPRKSVGKSPKQSAIAKADFVDRVKFIQDLLYLLSYRRPAFCLQCAKTSPF